MTKPIFSSKPKRAFPWGRLIAVLAVAGLLAYAGMQWRNRRAGPAGPGTKNAAAEIDIDSVVARFDAGDYAGARDLLKPWLATPLDGERGPKLALLDAEISVRLKQPAEAIARLEAAAKTYAGSARRPEIAVRLAALLDEAQRFDEAAALYEDISKNAPPGMRAAAYVGLGKRLERANDLPGARDHYRNAVRDAEFDTPEWIAAAAELGRMNVALIFSPQPTPESKVYAIEPGDNLTSIGIKLNTTQGLLLRANNLTETSALRPGQRLKYSPKDFRIVVERSKLRVFLVDKDGLFKYYRTGLGKQGYETTLGKYTIGNKQKDPTWFRPGGSPVPPNDPENELGTRWMPLVPTEAGLPTDLGIHGTIAPDTIGKYASHGCPRLLKEDVEELYDLVVRSTPVEIVESVSKANLEPAPAAAA